MIRKTAESEPVFDDGKVSEEKENTVVRKRKRIVSKQELKRCLFFTFST